MRKGKACMGTSAMSLHALVGDLTVLGANKSSAQGPRPITHAHSDDGNFPPSPNAPSEVQTIASTDEI